MKKVLSIIILLLLLFSKSQSQTIESLAEEIKQSLPQTEEVVTTITEGGFNHDSVYTIGHRSWGNYASYQKVTDSIKYLLDSLYTIKPIWVLPKEVLTKSLNESSLYFFSISPSGKVAIKEFHYLFRRIWTIDAIFLMAIIFFLIKTRVRLWLYWKTRKRGIKQWRKHIDWPWYPIAWLVIIIYVFLNIYLFLVPKTELLMKVFGTKEMISNIAVGVPCKNLEVKVQNLPEFEKIKDSISKSGKPIFVIADKEGFGLLSQSPKKKLRAICTEISISGRAYLVGLAEGDKVQNEVDFIKNLRENMKSYLFRWHEMSDG